MSRIQGVVRKLGWIGCLMATVVLLAGCPPQTESKGHLALVFTSGTAEESAKQDPEAGTEIPPEEILSLFVTMDEIALERVTDSGTELVVVFTGPRRVNLATLLSVSELLASASIPTGEYVAVQIALSNAEVEFLDPVGLVFPVGIVNAGLLRVETAFTVEADGEGILVLDIGGIHVFQLPDGSLELRPDLNATIAPESVIAQAIGEIAAVDFETGVLTLAHGDAALNVGFSQAVIFLPGDFDSPTGTVADLTVGTRILVLGELHIGGDFTANVIVVMPGNRDDDDDDGDDDGDDDDDDRDDDNEKIAICHVPKGSSLK